MPVQIGKKSASKFELCAHKKINRASSVFLLELFMVQ